MMTPTCVYLVYKALGLKDKIKEKQQFHACPADQVHGIIIVTFRAVQRNQSSLLLEINWPSILEEVVEDLL